MTLKGYQHSMTEWVFVFCYTNKKQNFKYGLGFGLEACFR